MSFGMTIRALRLGYRMMPNGAGWLRLSSTAKGILCSLVPADMRVPSKSPTKEYRCWWEDDDNGAALIRSSPFLRSLTKITKPFAVLIGEDGRLLDAGDGMREED